MSDFFYFEFDPAEFEDVAYVEFVALLIGVALEGTYHQPALLDVVFGLLDQFHFIRADHVDEFFLRQGGLLVQTHNFEEAPVLDDFGEKVVFAVVVFAKVHLLCEYHFVVFEPLKPPTNAGFERFLLYMSTFVVE